MLTARTHQRHLAILAVLHEEGPQSAHELRVATRMRRGQLADGLLFLAGAGLIAGDWESLPAPHYGTPRNWVYQITSDNQRAEHHRRGWAAQRQDAS